MASGHSSDSLPLLMLKPAHIYAENRDWPGYFQAVAGKGPRETLLAALDAFRRTPRASQSGSPAFGPNAPSLPLAIDLGCGEGRDTAELLRNNFAVLAIDSHPQAATLLAVRLDITPEMHTRLRFLQAGFEHLTLPPAALVNASFALPFCPPAYFAALWGQITNSLPPGGLFCGQLFGDQDSWATLPDRSHHTHQQVLDLLQPFKVIDLKEENKPGQEFDGTTKHRHVFHIVAAKK